MALKKPKKLTDNTSSIINSNDSNPMNFSHRTEQENTSFELQVIELEDLDMMVINFFDNYFTIDGKNLRLINGMVDVASVKFLYPEIYNQEKETFIKPIFTVKRTNVSPKFRSNASYKPNVYVIPQMKPQGLVYTEYTVTPVKYIDIEYEFIFLTTFKDTQNELITAIREYFANKRNILEMNGERFTIRPTDDLERLFDNDESTDINRPKEYILSFSMTLEGYLRSKDSIQKRERPNNYTVEFKTQHGRNFKYETIAKLDYKLNPDKDSNEDKKSYE